MKTLIGIFVAVAFFAPSFASALLTTSIVSYYKLDGDSTDAASTNNGSDTAITYNASNGIITQGAGTNGSTSHISTADAAFNIGSGDFTYNMWLKTSSGAATYVAVGKYSGSGNDYWIGIASGKFTAEVLGSGSGTSQVASAASTYADGNFHMLTITRSGSTLSMYVDNGTPTTVSNSYTSNPGGAMQIGKFGTGSTFYWPGAIDEVGFWTRALSSSEVNDLYNSGTGCQYPFSPLASPQCIASASTGSNVNSYSFWW